MQHRRGYIPETMGQIFNGGVTAIKRGLIDVWQIARQWPGVSVQGAGVRRGQRRLFSSSWADNRREDSIVDDRQQVPQKKKSFFLPSFAHIQAKTDRLVTPYRFGCLFQSAHWSLNNNRSKSSGGKETKIKQEYNISMKEKKYERIVS